jgi:protein-S-isoprenylcysteine O-methyltransferase Ste14
MRTLLQRFQSLLGVGIHLLVVGLLLEGMALLVRPWISFPISPSRALQVLLTIPCVAGCLAGLVWFNRASDLVRVHLLAGDDALITDGPFAYVRHPLYSSLLLTLPPLLIIWLADLLFAVSWVVLYVVAHVIVRFEERGLVERFGQQYEDYRRQVPALLPYRCPLGRRRRLDP